MWLRYKSTKEWQEVGCLAISHEDYNNAKMHEDESTIIDGIKSWAINRGVSEKEFKCFDINILLDKFLFVKDDEIPLLGEDDFMFKFDIKYQPDEDIVIITLLKLIGESSVEIENT